MRHLFRDLPTLEVENWQPARWMALVWDNHSRARPRFASSYNSMAIKWSRPSMRAKLSRHQCVFVGNVGGWLIDPLTGCSRCACKSSATCSARQTPSFCRGGRTASAV